MLGQLGLAQTGMMADLGQRYQQRELERQMAPLQLQFQLAELLKSGQAQRTPSPFEMLSQGAGMLGGALGGLSFFS
jgi:hypothetical protein